MKCDSYCNSGRESGYLNEMCPGETAVILSLNAKGGIRRRLIDLGFISGTNIRCVLTGRHKESSAYLVRNTLIALRKEDASLIRIRPAADHSGERLDETVCKAAECEKP